jgi:hypothetical protein
MKHFFRNYSLEAVVVIAGLLVSAGAYFIFGRILNVGKDQLAYVSVASAGLLFIVGHVYSRLKERRDSKRKRAQELFLEWHSKDIRESRIFVCRWREIHSAAALPALGELEKEASKTYRAQYQQTILIKKSEGEDFAPMKTHPIDDLELKELHFFRVYQFFERWSLLLKNSDIDQRSASEYMASYKNWYLQNFVKPWFERETDVHLKESLRVILERVSRDR